MAGGSGRQRRDGCFACPHRDRSGWRSLGDAELELIDRARRTRMCAAGGVLFEQGDHDRCVYCVKSGTIAERRLDGDGNAALLELSYPSDLVGYRAFLTGAEHSTNAEAVGPAMVCVIDGAAVERVMAASPELTLDLLRRQALALEQAQEKLFRSATLSNRDRLLHLLRDLLRRHGSVAADGSCRIDLPLSRRDLASMIGVRHETLSRIIGRLEAEGLAQFSGRHVAIPSIRALVAACARRAAE